MCGERWCLHLTFEIVSADGFQRHWIHGKGRSIFFHCEEHAPPEYYVGIRGCANDALDELVVGVDVAVSRPQKFENKSTISEASDDQDLPSKQGFTSFSLIKIPICLHISLPKVNMPVLNPYSRHSAIPVEMDIIFVDGRKTVVWLYTVECTIDLSWDDTVDFQVEDIAFDSGGCVESFETVRARKFDLIRLLLSANVVGGDLGCDVVYVGHGSLGARVVQDAHEKQLLTIYS